MVPRIDTLLVLKDHLAAFHALLSGEFDTELARLEALKTEVEGKLGLLKTADDARSLTQKAEDYFSSKFDEAESLVAKAFGHHEEAKAAIAAHAITVQEFAATQAAAQVVAEAAQVALDAKAADIAAQAKVLEDAQAAHQVAVAALATQQAAVNAQAATVANQIATIQAVAASTVTA